MTGALVRVDGELDGSLGLAQRPILSLQVDEILVLFVELLGLGVGVLDPCGDPLDEFDLAFAHGLLLPLGQHDQDLFHDLLCGLAH